MNPEITNTFYRISMKALVLDGSKMKFLIVQEDNGKWEFPGGGLDWGEKPQDCLARELREEVGLAAVSISPTPAYFMSVQRDDGKWAAYVFYEVAVADLKFTHSSECVDLKFVSKDEVEGVNVFRSVKDFSRLFDPKNHG